MLEDVSKQVDVEDNKDNKDLDTNEGLGSNKQTWESTAYPTLDPSVTTNFLTNTNV